MTQKYNKYDIDTGEIYRDESRKGQFTDLPFNIIDKLGERIFLLLKKYKLVSKHKDEELNYRIQKYENLNNENLFDEYSEVQYPNPEIFPKSEIKFDENGNVLSSLFETKVIEEYDPKHYCYDLYDFDQGIIITYKDDPEDYPFLFSLMLRNFEGEDRIGFIQYQGKKFFNHKWTKYKSFLKSCLFDHKVLYDENVLDIVYDWIKINEKQGISQPVLALYYHYMMKARQMKSFESYNLKGLESYEHVLKKNGHDMLGNDKRSVKKFYNLYKAIKKGSKDSPIKPKFLKEVILLLEENPEAQEIAGKDLQSFIM